MDPTNSQVIVADNLVPCSSDNVLSMILTRNVDAKVLQSVCFPCFRHDSPPPLGPPMRCHASVDSKLNLGCLLLAEAHRRTLTDNSPAAVCLWDIINLGYLFCPEDRL